MECASRSWSAHRVVPSLPWQAALLFQDLLGPLWLPVGQSPGLRRCAYWYRTPLNTLPVALSPFFLLFTFSSLSQNELILTFSPSLLFSCSLPHPIICLSPLILLPFPFFLFLPPAISLVPPSLFLRLSRTQHALSLFLSLFPFSLHLPCSPLPLSPTLFSPFICLPASSSSAAGHVTRCPLFFYSPPAWRQRLPPETQLCTFPLSPDTIVHLCCGWGGAPVLRTGSHAHWHCSGASQYISFPRHLFLFVCSPSAPFHRLGVDISITSTGVYTWAAENSPLPWFSDAGCTLLSSHSTYFPIKLSSQIFTKTHLNIPRQIASQKSMVMIHSLKIKPDSKEESHTVLLQMNDYIMGILCH